MKVYKFSSPTSPQKQLFLPRNANHSLTPDRSTCISHPIGQIQDEFQNAINTNQNSFACQNSGEILSAIHNSNDSMDLDENINDFTNTNDISILISSIKGKKMGRHIKIGSI